MKTVHVGSYTGEGGRIIEKATGKIYFKLDYFSEQAGISEAWVRKYPEEMGTVWVETRSGGKIMHVPESSLPKAKKKKVVRPNKAVVDESLAMEKITALRFTASKTMRAEYRDTVLKAFPDRDMIPDNMDLERSKTYIVSRHRSMAGVVKYLVGPSPSKADIYRIHLLESDMKSLGKNKELQKRFADILSSLPKTSTKSSQNNLIVRADQILKTGVKEWQKHMERLLDDFPKP